jgi:hypothetical protein
MARKQEAVAALWSDFKALQSESEPSALSETNEQQLLKVIEKWSGSGTPNPRRQLEIDRRLKIQHCVYGVDGMRQEV